MLRRPLSSNAFVDGACPIDWSHPFNRGLIGAWCVPPIPGWRGGLTMRDMVRGGKNPNDGTLVNGIKWVGDDRLGKYGALSLASSSTQSVTLPTWTIPNAVTFSIWFIINDLSQSYTGIFSNEDNGSFGTGATYYVKSNGKTAFYLRLTSGLNSYDGTGAITLTTGTPYMATCVYDSVNGCVTYINGVVDGSFAAAGTVSSAGNRTLGSDVLFSGRNLTGLLNNFYIWNRALAQYEVLAIYREQRLGSLNILRWISTRDWSLPNRSSGFRSRLGNGLIKKGNIVGVGSAIV